MGSGMNRRNFVRNGLLSSVALATVLFPALARFASRRDYEGLRRTMANGIRQIFMLLGTVALLPLVLAYIGFVYWIFRGKVREGEGYH